METRRDTSDEAASLEIRRVSNLPSSKTSRTTSSPLLHLPAELRNLIWRHLLLHHPWSGHPSTPSSLSRFCANILRVCRQTHREGLAILYAENLFAAHPQLLSTLPRFVLRRHPTPVVTLSAPILHAHLIAMIRRFYIFVRLDTDPSYDATQVARAFSHLAELHVEVFQAMFGGSDFGVLRLFEEVRGVGEVTIGGSVGDGRYVGWLAATMRLPAGQTPTKARPEAPTGDEVRGSMAWRNGHR